MKNRTLAVWFGISALSGNLLHAEPISTAFTYQGRLLNAGVPAAGTNEMVFCFFTNYFGTDVQICVTNIVPVDTNGVFQVKPDIGTLVARNVALFLELGVRSNSTAPFQMLSPRQEITPVPYSLYTPNAGTAALADSVAPSSVTGMGIQNASITSDKLIDGAGSGLEADLLDGFDSTAFWKTGGNSGTTAGTHFLGTTDNQPLEIRVNGNRAMRFEPSAGGTPNVIGGSILNFVTAGVTAATIAGGWNNSIDTNSSYSSIGGGELSIIRHNSGHSTIGGGYYSLINANSTNSTIAGGYGNVIAPEGTGAPFSTIGGGYLNQNNSPKATIAGGERNTIQIDAPYSTINGGVVNTNSGWAATIGGGEHNTVQAQHATVGGGFNNWASTDFATVAGGAYNSSSGHSATVGGGYSNVSSGEGATVGGGISNHSVDYATVGGGLGNISSINYATVGGGRNNTSSALQATVGGGAMNRATGSSATVAGGTNNLAGGHSATVGGGWGNTAAFDYNTVGGGRGNAASNAYSTVSGGRVNTAAANYATVPGGFQAHASRLGQMAYASGAFANAGDAQTSVHVLRNTTSSSTETELFLDGSFSQIVLPDNAAWAFDILVVGRNTTGSAAVYTLKGGIEKVDLIGSVTKTVHEDAGATGWDARVSAGDEIGGYRFKILVTGDSTSIRWVATVRTAEVINP